MAHGGVLSLPTDDGVFSTEGNTRSVNGALSSAVLKMFFFIGKLLSGALPY